MAVPSLLHPRWTLRGTMPRLSRITRNSGSGGPHFVCTPRQHTRGDGHLWNFPPTHAQWLEDLSCYAPSLGMLGPPSGSWADGDPHWFLSVVVLPPHGRASGIRETPSRRNCSRGGDLVRPRGSRRHVKTHGACTGGPHTTLWMSGPSEAARCFCSVTAF